MNNTNFPELIMYGHAYVPNQTLTKVFTPYDGLKHGTMFPELVSPYVPSQSKAVIDYLKNDERGCK